MGERSVRSMRLNPFGTALAVSAAIHLSMVTLFSIVVYVPRYPANFSRVELLRGPIQARGLMNVKEDTPPPFERDLAQRARISADQMQTRVGEFSVDLLPKLDLPALRSNSFAAPLKIDAAARVDRYEGTRYAPDSWARFGQEIGALRGRIGQLGSLVGLDTQSRAVTPVSQTDAGVTATIEWAPGDAARDFLIRPPLGALWDIRPGSAYLPLNISFSVDARGRVTDALPPPQDAGGVTARLVAALRNFQFENLDDQNAPLQRATLVIAAEAPTS